MTRLETVTITGCGFVDATFFLPLDEEASDA